MPLIHINNDAHFEEELREAGSQTLIVCDFFATWCGPCRFVAPRFKTLSDKYPSVKFLKIDVDLCKDLSQSFQIQAMPTFLILLNNGERARIQGGNLAAVEEAIISNQPPVSSTSSTPKDGEKIASAEERKWLANILNHTEQVKQYEDEVNQILAISLVPQEKLLADSTINGKLSSFQLAKNLMDWFHSSFFKWTKAPVCETCKVTSCSVGHTTANEIEKEDGASNVELYSCPGCNNLIRFPRYNKVAKLLETRNGRCGEWANCFALFCRAMGLETRWVNDNLDHVWIEIFDADLDRWVHCDPCENVIDTPLMYDKGWNKKHAYVFAYGSDHVRDVTWRYSYDHSAVLKRRTNCREPVLQNFLSKLNKRLTKDRPKERIAYLNRDFLKELIEFLSPKNQLRDGSTAETKGRTSGDKEWRESRGESKPNEPILIKPTEKEISSKCFILKYNCVEDNYFRPNDNPENSIRGFEALLNENKNIFRKVERDWDKSYLCRKENTKSGTISWKIDLKDLNVDKVEIDMGKFTTFEQGRIMATACCGDFCSLIPDNGKVVIEEVGKADYLEILIEFQGGKINPEEKWQNAQLFRTDNNQACDNMIIKVHFK